MSEGQSGLDDWMVDEITSNGKNKISHEIILASDTTIIIHCKGINLERISDIDPSWQSSELYNVGVDYFKKQDYENALQYFLNASKLNEHASTFARMYECL